MGAHRAFPIVGIGASAGGLEALEELFSNMPTDTGMAFVVVTHQHPGHTSMLPELLSRKTQLSVVEVTERMPVEPNRVYVAPPGGHLDILNGCLFRMEIGRDEPPHLPIDHFLRSLAQEQREKAICIILSGTGTDGTLGMKAIKGESGMAMVQQVESAKYAGMPSSAIAGGLSDYILPPAEMPAQLVSYAHGPYMGGAARSTKSIELPEEPMQKIFVLLRAQTGHDFSGYKRSTVSRRIERRLNIHSIRKPEDYVRFLQENPHEIDVLFKELLISVTNFFRDPEAFEFLGETALPELLRSLPENGTLRGWVPGCATGEEVYSLAILLRESMEAVKRIVDVQIFGTDLDSAAIDSARTGLFSEGIAVDVSPERLKRFFRYSNNSYQVHKDIREMVVFAVQNVIKDPPFTKLDFISCRNLLIYLNADLQQKLLPVFHYALKPGGLLFLGPSETIGAFSGQFEVVDKKWKIFRRRETPFPIHKMLDFSSTPATLQKPEMVSTVQPPEKMREGGIARLVDRLLLARFAPPSVVVNDRGEVIFIYGRTGDYLEPAAGQPRLNVHDMAREGLKIELASVLREAASAEGKIARREGVRVRANNGFVFVDLTAQRVLDPESLRGLLLITFQPRPVPTGITEPIIRVGHDLNSNLMLELERELQHTKESLNTTIEELETSNEELKSTNEELQSTNEELQSSNEELETSKEEMQSLNEELTTVNGELNSKIEDLTRVNSDMHNLLNSTEIATIFLDNELRIKRFTEAARNLIKLIPGDVGRPLADLASNLNYESLVEDGREVLRTLVFKMAEVQTREGMWYLMRIMPYRTAENVIDGLVVTFVDINRVKKAEQDLASAKERLAADLDAMTRLHEIGSLFLLEGVTPTIFDEVLDAAISISDADMGYIQRLDAATGKLKIMEQRGFKRSWLNAWERVELSGGSFGLALKRGERLHIDSVGDSKFFAGTPILDGLLKAGVQAMQCTPLISHSGKLFGVLSTHYKGPHHPDERSSRLLDLLARQTAEILERAECELDR